MRVLRQLLLVALVIVFRSRAPGNGCTEATEIDGADNSKCLTVSYGMNSRGTNALFKRRPAAERRSDVAGRFLNRW